MKLSLKMFCFLTVMIYCVDLNSHSEAFFSPDDHPTKRLIQLIDSTHKKIYAAVYMFTDKEIAEALIKAKKRGVDVKMIVDRATVDYEYGKAKVLKENGIDVYLFSEETKKGNGKYSALMHNKFAILDEQLWTGSFNWTKSANQKNQENVILTTNKKVRQKFEQQFEVLKQRCVACKATQRPRGDSESLRSIWDSLMDLIFQTQKVG